MNIIERFYFLKGEDKVKKILVFGLLVVGKILYSADSYSPPSPLTPKHDELVKEIEATRARLDELDKKLHDAVFPVAGKKKAAKGHSKKSTRKSKHSWTRKKD